MGLTCDTRRYGMRLAAVVLVLCVLQSARARRAGDGDRDDHATTRTLTMDSHSEVAAGPAMIRRIGLDAQHHPRGPCGFGDHSSLPGSSSTLECQTASAYGVFDCDFGFDSQ